MNLGVDDNSNDEPGIRVTRARASELTLVADILKEKIEYLNNPRMRSIVFSNATHEDPLKIKLTNKQRYELAERCKITGQARAYLIKRALDQYLYPPPQDVSVYLVRVIRHIIRSFVDKKDSLEEIIEIPPISLGNRQIEIRITKSEEK